MSKFFQKDATSSSEDESSEEEQKQQKKVTAKKAPASKAKKFYGGDSDDDSDEEREVVKTTADKRTEALKSVFDKMKNHIKIQDFTHLQTDFDEIQDEMEKCVGATFATDKFQTLPSWVCKGIAALEDAVLEVTPEQKKKMNKLNAQAFNKVKQKLKKYLVETGDDENRYVAQIAKYRENPQESEEDDDKADSDDDSDDDSGSSSDESSSEDEDSDEKPKAKKTKKAADSSSEDESSGSSSSSDEDSSKSGSDSDGKAAGSSDEDSDEGGVVKPGQLPKKYGFLALPREEMTPAQRRWKWVAFEQLPEDMKQYIRPPKETKIRDRKEKDTGPKDVEITDQVIEIEDDKDLDFTKQENVDKILTKYRNQQTSRKNFDINQHIEVLDIMFVAQGPGTEKLDLKIEILMLLISSYFTSAKKTLQGYFNRDTWLTTNGKLSQLLELLDQKVFTHGDDKEQQAAKIEDDDGGDIDSFLRSSDSQILPALVNFIEKLDQQLFKAFQSLSQTDMQYLHRLRDECILIRQCDSVAAYLKKQKGEEEKVAKVGIIKLEHIYYKNDSLYTKTREALKDKPAALEQIYFLSAPSQEVIQELVTQVLDNCSNRFKIRATLLQTFHHAIHNRYFEARDLIMKAHFGSTIAKQPIAVQIIYNRAIVQIGLSAFRLGLFNECNQVLVDVCQSPKLKESLAQGTSNYRTAQEKTLEEEIEEKKRFIPPHLQINLEVIDCVYMTTSLLLEVPNISENRFDISKTVISRNFRKLIEQYDMKGMQFVAQNSRDHIVFAARQLHKSQWREAFNNISQIKIFKRMKDFQDGPLREALLLRFKETALKIFLIDSATQYESFSLETTSSQFELPKAVLLKQISKLIMNNTIQAKIDHSSGAVILESASNDDDRRQMEHLQFSHLDKVRQMVDANERCMEMLTNQNYHVQHNKAAGESRGGKR